MNRTVALLSLLCLFGPAFASASATVTPYGGTYSRYQVQADASEITLIFTTIQHTCKENRGFLNGDIKTIDVPAGTYTSVQQVVADLGVLTPLMICHTPNADFALTREMKFSSLPNMTSINLDILVPSDISVLIK